MCGDNTESLGSKPGTPTPRAMGKDSQKEVYNIGLEREIGLIGGNKQDPGKRKR